ncbi:Ig-like domain-containing protein [Vibrio sp. VPAP30]|uniref:Ig-like domain-containing protein n=1 Tax=Vibrio sp. VPAP30 TaxID=1647102 RepID=UPI000659E035|nr:Ig-like domain-containing protein [Vibrio sp. VPAP30]KLN65404.1 MSHA biogenesis protein MshQ [Vibrio sp. VPAP30]
MKLIRLLSIFAGYLLMSSVAVAACLYQGNKDFTVSFTVVASDSYQSFYLKQGSHGYTLWYTQTAQVSSDYIFNEQSLTSGETYQIRIVSDFDSATGLSHLTYYRNSGSGWHLIEQKVQALEYGAHSPITSPGISSVECLDSADSLNICSYVPDGLQTNSYTGSPVQAFGAMSVSGSGNRVYPTSSNPKFSFQAIFQPSDLCEYPEGSSGGLCSFDPSKTFSTLPMPTPDYGHGNTDLICNSSQTCPLNSGYYRDITIKQNAKLQLTGGEYWLNELRFAEQNAQLEILAPSILHYKRIYFDQTSIQINQAGDSEDLLIIGHGANSAIKFPDHGVDGNYQVKAFFYVDPIATNETNGFIIEGDGNQIRGGITANSIAISGRDNKIYPLSCNTEPTTVVTSIDIKPFNYHLTCEASPENIVEVHVLDSNGNPVSGYTPTLEQENGSNLTLSFVSEVSGIATYQVTTHPQNRTGNYDLKASLTTGGQTFTDTDQIKFVPYKFEVADQYVTAGQNNQVPVKVKACSNNGQLITLGYTGSPSAAFTYQRPTSAVVDAGDLSFTANLSDSNRQADYNFKESGQIRVTITDNSFVCDDVRCPVEGGALKGQFDVYSRPWKIAICDVKETGGSNKANPATTTGSPGFVPGGTGFSATYKPITHGDSNVGVSDECNYLLTGNYSLDNGPLNLAYSVSYPTTSPQIGTVTPSVIPNFSSGSETQTINHSWTEVGTLSLQTSASYLTMSVDPDTQNVGRFYPKYFQVINTPIWNYPGVGASEQNFAYMNQPFNGVEFYVEALNLQGNSVQNYGNFVASNTAGFALYEANPTYTSRFHSGTPSKAWAVSSSKSIGTFKLEENSPSTTCANELCWAKATPADGYEDGPFNTSGGTASTISIDAVSGNADPIDYQSSGQPRLLTSQPVIYFGRAVLDSIGGVASSTMNIPLRIEFWNGSGFVTHSGDDTTNIAGINVVSDNHTIWVDNGSTAENVNLAAGGVVTDGASNSITVSQSAAVAAVRQQTQVWLDLHRGANIVPWLRYRWQDANRTEVNGEEDPSTVVTFGIFRGNDRVIFRGESGLTGQ